MSPAVKPPAKARQKKEKNAEAPAVAAAKRIRRPSAAPTVAESTAASSGKDAVQAAAPDTGATNSASTVALPSDGPEVAPTPGQLVETPCGCDSEFEATLDQLCEEALAETVGLDEGGAVEAVDELAARDGRSLPLSPLADVADVDHGEAPVDKLAAVDRPFNDVLHSAAASPLEIKSDHEAREDEEDKCLKTTAGRGSTSADDGGVVAGGYLAKFYSCAGSSTVGWDGHISRNPGTPNPEDLGWQRLRSE